MDFFRFERLRVLPQFSNACAPARHAAAGAATIRAAWRAALAVACFALAATAGAQERAAAPAANAPDSMHYGWADVLRVDPVFEEGSSEPQQECYEEQVLVQPGQTSEADDGKRIGGTVLGAIIGGVIGSRFGKGDGRKAAAAAGAVAGGAIGNNLASTDPRAPAAPRYATQRKCRPVEGAASRRVVAYDVEFRYRGELYNARMNTDPGDRMRVRVSVTPAE